jgi:Tol biopolymer transport system component
MQITPDGRTVIYSLLDGQAFRLFKVAMTGGPVTRLTSEASNYGSISPDGKLIASAWKSPFNPKLAIISVNGGTPMRIFDISGYHYRWTPDGKGIVYIKHDGKQENLFVQPLAGGPPTALTNFTEGSIEDNYEWSADGTRIVLTHYIKTSDIVLLGAS